MKTYSPKPEHIVRRWYVIDASGLVLGRLASEVAAILRGKHKPIFAPHMDVGDNVIVINAAQIEMTGGKEAKKISYRHSGYPGGITGTRYDTLLATKPEWVIEKAVRGMLPKNSLGRSMIKKLHVVPGTEHPHQAQQPVPYTLGQPPVWEGLPQKQPRPTRRASKVTTAPTPDKPEAKKPAAKPKTTAKSAAKSPAKKSAAKKPAAKQAKKTAAADEAGAGNAADSAPPSPPADPNEPPPWEPGSGPASASPTAITGFGPSIVTRWPGSGLARTAWRMPRRFSGRSPGSPCATKKSRSGSTIPNTLSPRDNVSPMR